MPKISANNLRDVSEAIVQNIDEQVMPENSVYLAVNLMFDKTLGRAIVRDGTTLFGTQIAAGKSCVGLFQHNNADGTKVPLAVFNTVLYKYVSGAWASAATSLNATAKCHFATFLDTTVFTNGAETPRSSADGENWVVTAGNLDVGNMPHGKYVIEFQDRIYTAGVTGDLDRLYYSSTPTAGAISWTTGNGNIDIEVEEGAGPITGLAKVPGYLLIFKERSMKRWDTSSTYPESLINVGAPSQEAIVMAKQSVFYYNPKVGIMETTGNYPRKISRRVQAIMDVIPAAYYTSVSGWSDGEILVFSIGDITLGDLTLTNCVLARMIDNQTWTLLSFPDEYKAWTTYVDSNGKEELLAGDDDGQVWRVLQGTGDAGSMIKWLLQYQPQEFGSRGRIKNLSKFVVYSKNVTDGQLSAKTDGTGNFEPIGGVTDQLSEVIKDLHGRYFEFRLQGTGTEGDIIGIDFPELEANLNFKE